MAVFNGLILPMLIMGVIFYFLIIKPNKKQKQEHYDLISSLKVKDEIVTIGGIYGRVTKIEEDFVVIQSTTKGTIKVTKQSVSKKYSKEA
ncbi:MAG: preprotein translocase subunit YajC [Mycoplasmatales bacterium]